MSGSLLVRVEPEICHPANCWGRMAVVVCVAGVVRAPSPAKAVPINKTSKQINVFMTTEGSGREPLDY
jgi:hypothetical protein